MSIIERFWKKVNKTKTCWLWTAAKTTGGYGKFWFPPRLVDAHRASYTLLVGEIPTNKHVLHTCDIRHCVNPDHLFIGTAYDNLHDAIKKGRWNPNWGTAPIIQRNKTHCLYSHEYTVENTYHPPGRIGRWCRTCHREYERARRANAKRT